MNLRFVTCDIPGCGSRHEEINAGDGFSGWGQLQGIILNGVPNPLLCPIHLSLTASFVDNLRGEDVLHKS